VKAQEFLERAKVEIDETVDASKVRFPKADAVAVVRAKGNRVITLRGEADLKNDPPDDDTLAAMILGPTGNLKAPTILVGKTLIVGFVKTAYEKYLA
jgi:hypothetical protein